MSVATEPTISTRQRAAIKHMIENPRARQAEVAEAVGVSDRTLRSWAALPHFAAALDEATAESAAAARGRARRLHGQVIDELVALALDDPSPSIRLRACVELLTHVHNHDLDDLVQRLDDLEARQREEHAA